VAVGFFPRLWVFYERLTSALWPKRLIFSVCFSHILHERYHDYRQHATYFNRYLLDMLPQNVINPEKSGKISGNVFHLFYMDLNTLVLFDKDLNIPIMWGGKTLVIGFLKKISDAMNVKPDHKIRVYSYILDYSNGFRKIQTYNGPIETIGKYLIRY
jgi:hypothetical protein